ncbi:hypothetical protein B0T10DRAFT_464444 [Thelonectria olida]|uniref:Uncharacterized protein n=1 Tax=Thelonectria olida TaxID=1576542 RepID=A0A9P9AKI4_9HYPO|nr:hypothetical protein B0T10DRAFT_464444 [Thelonectria olida]
MALRIALHSSGIPPPASVDETSSLRCVTSLSRLATAVWVPWLASKSREEEALQNLAKLRRLPESDSRIHLEWMHIIAETCFQNDVLAERHPDLTSRHHVTSNIKLEIVTGWTASRLAAGAALW